MILARFNHILFKKSSIAPLVSFRICIGLLLLYSTYRSYAKGWIKENYIDPQFHFSFIKNLDPLPNNGMYYIFILLGISALCITLGLFYKLNTILHFTLFSYVELLDKTFYLNHYYLVTLILFWLIWVPANRAYSMDCLLFPRIKSNTCSNWHILIFKIQLSIVYFFAGIAKINGDWLLKAQPLATWLPGRYQIPLLGSLMKYKLTAYLFSWAGCFYDTSIWFFLWLKRTRNIAYLLVIIFHVLTGILFPSIGMFPYIMIGSTIIFFSSEFHSKLLNLIGAKIPEKINHDTDEPKINVIVSSLLIAYFLVQLFLPLRYLQYSGNIFWNEKGYRFSWRVMLMEKSGLTTFILKDPKSNIQNEIDQDEYLTPFQKQQMRSQPDMILQFAKHIGDEFKDEKGYSPEIYVESRLSLNGRRSQNFTNKKIDVYLANNPMKENWIIPLNK